MTNPGLKIVIVESGREAAAALSQECSEGRSHDHHVFCEGAEEPLHAFAARVLDRLKRLRRTSPICSVSYIMGNSREASERLEASCPEGQEKIAGRTRLLRELTKQLQRGSNLAIIATPETKLNLLEIVDPLLAFAPIGATVRARLSRGTAHRRDDTTLMDAKPAPTDATLLASA